MLGHFFHRGRLGLLAAGALEEPLASRVLAHARSCAACAADLASLERAHRALIQDAALERPLPIPSDALRARVLARVRMEQVAKPAPGFRLVPLASALALVGTGVIAGLTISRLSPVSAPTPPTATASLDGGDAAMNAEFYDRLEKTRARASAARYLEEAQGVLIQVASAADCPEAEADNVNVAREAETSRALLRRRAALVASSPEMLLAARGVMEEVEGVLQEVADLPQCTRRSDVDEIARRVDRKKLLMKIDLVAQELVAP